LPKAELQVTSTSRAGATTVTVKNPGKSLAFGVRLKLVRDTDREEVLPVLWEDNYLALLPGESRRLTASYSAKDLGPAHPLVLVEGWNVR
jgi:exo-1,4-beta-D-glucosaminidase